MDKGSNGRANYKKSAQVIDYTSSITRIVIPVVVGSSPISHPIKSISYHPIVANFVIKICVFVR